jgi:hypothetical protein
MASTYTNLGIELMATGENAGTWGTKTNANLNLAEQLLGGFKIQTLNAAGSGANTTALTVEDGALTGAAQNRVIILGAVSPQAITGNKVVTFPLLTETFYFIKNSTSGAYTVQLKAESGSGATVTFSATDKGYKAVYLDGVATNTGVIEIPLSPADGVTLTGTQTLTNKTLTDPILSPTATTAGKVEFLEGTNNGTNKATLIGPASTADVTLTLPASTDTLVGKATTDTLTNKTINGSQLIDATVPLAKLANGTDGNIISYDASGAVVAVATGNAGQILTSAGSGAPPTFADAAAGGTDWQAVKTGNYTAVAGQGIFANTAGGAFTVTLPSSPSIGDEVTIVDYGGTFDTYNLTVGRNSQKIQGSAADLTVATERAGFTLAFTDGTQGWLLKNN